MAINLPSGEQLAAIVGDAVLDVTEYYTRHHDDYCDDSVPWLCPAEVLGDLADAIVVCTVCAIVRGLLGAP